LFDIKKIESELTSKTFINKIYYFSEIESTNTFAKNLKGHDNVLVLTDKQSAGRGRFERSWISDENSSLTFTIIIKKHFINSDGNSQIINFFSCYCVFKAIQNILSYNLPGGLFNLTIKWPNDILLEGKKICGLLIENNSRSSDFVIGIGINVNQDSFPEEISGSAISLKLFLGKELDLSYLLIDTIKVFNENMHLLIAQNSAKIFELWKNNNDFIGKKIAFMTLGNVERDAQIIDFSEDGGIKLNIDNKEIVYYSGDIKILRKPGL
jgi:BirA family biotin operon repressor/biotin-[acetyl-CoA-carboxylase] ligase